VPGAQGLPEVLLQKPSGLLPHPNLKYQASFTFQLSIVCGIVGYGILNSFRKIYLFKKTIRDAYSGSRVRIFSHTQNQISGPKKYVLDPRSGSATLLAVLIYFFSPAL
jgi:hypothetical protein